jgi:adenosylcobinamide kinase/adenosylcobinamide-phosphate guanylyltransferase
MAAKVRDHQATRGSNWATIEEPLDLARALASAPQDAPVLIDCATMWLSNLMLGEHDITAATQAFLAALNTHNAPVVIVSNEVGHGIVPDNALARAFRNAQGRLNQELAAAAQTVVMITAGLPQVLKGQIT